MTNRERALRLINVGDIFNAEDEAGPVRICLTIVVTQATILARSITTQELIEFNRATGTATHLWHSARYNYVITSTAPLPHDIHDVMLSLDRRYRESEYKWAEDPEWESSPREFALTEEQKRGLLFVSDFYGANPAPT